MADREAVVLEIVAEHVRDVGSLEEPERGLHGGDVVRVVADREALDAG